MVIAMLGLNYDVEIDIKSPTFPVYFKNKNICIHCGAHALSFVNVFGRTTSNKNSIDPFEHIKCMKCGRVYSILWEPGDDGEMKPTAVEHNIQREFSNFVRSYGNNTYDKNLQ